MHRVIAEAIDTGHTFKSSVDLTNVRLDWGELVITLTCGGDRKVAMARFSEIMGFRLLDEGDLLEFWPACARDNGWLYRIKEHGWSDLEASRPGFLLEQGLGLVEYFISSENNCISILSSAVPKVEIFSI